MALKFKANELTYASVLGQIEINLSHINLPIIIPLMGDLLSELKDASDLEG